MRCVRDEMGFAREVADRVLFMDEGQIIEDRLPAEFFVDPHHERARKLANCCTDPRAYRDI